MRKMNKKAWISGAAAIMISACLITAAILIWQQDLRKEQRLSGAVPIYSAEEADQAKKFLEGFVKMEGSRLAENENLITWYELRTGIQHMELWNEFYDRVIQGQDAAVVFASYSWEAMVDVIYISYLDGRFYIIRDYSRDGYSGIGADGNPYREKTFDYLLSFETEEGTRYYMAQQKDLTWEQMEEMEKQEGQTKPYLALPQPVDLEALEREQTVLAARQEASPDLDQKIAEAIQNDFIKEDSRELFCAEAHKVYGVLERQKEIKVYAYALCQSFETAERPLRGEYYRAEIVLDKTAEGEWELRSLWNANDWNQFMKDLQSELPEEYDWELGEEHEALMWLSQSCLQQAQEHWS